MTLLRRNESQPPQPPDCKYMVKESAKVYKCYTEQEYKDRFNSDKPTSWVDPAVAIALVLLCVATATLVVLDNRTRRRNNEHKNKI